MRRKRLLCSTALVSACLLMTGSALTQEPDEEAQQEEEAPDEAAPGEEAPEEEAPEEEAPDEEAPDEEAPAEGEAPEVVAPVGEEEEQARPGRVGGIEVVLGGTTESGVQAGSKNTITGESDRNYSFFMDNEVFIEARGATESGILYGSTIILEVGSGGLDGDSPVTEIDEAALFFSSSFGRFEFGRRDGAEQLMYVGAEEAQAGTGGIDGDIPNINFIEFENTDIAAKATYFTPRVAGFQLGASFTPDYEDNGGENQFQGEDLEGENGVGGGVNWVGALGPLDLTLAAVGMFGECESNCTNGTDDGEGFQDEQKSWAVGALLGFGEFTLGAGYNRQDDFAPETQDNDIVNFGLMYGFEEADVSFGYSFNGFGDSAFDDSHLFVLSGNIGLLPGVTLLADVSYNTNDIEACCRIEDDEPENRQSATWGGVLSIELEY
jgi:outer membrane protein OmpU